MSLSENPFSPMASYDTQKTISSISSLDPKLSRTHYYDGRLLRASDLTRDQFYLDERLREVGRALGQGIVNGFDVTLLPNRQLQVSGGIAVTPSGRVLELETKSTLLNLTDAALINELNPGFRSLEPGLYVVVVRYAEKGSGSAEIYPRDLQAERGFHFNAYQEGVQFGLVKLPINLPLEKIQRISAQEVSVYIRALLVRQLVMGTSGQPQIIGEDAVALGVMGVEYGIAQWLDKGLLRRPFRSVQAMHYMQQDLYTHYEELFADVLSVRNSTANQDKFLAARYFSVLPPVGSLPKMAIDPINAYQHYFPEKFEVSISPVREDDLPSLIQQSLALEPIDLATDKDVDILIAIVLDDVSFSLVARKLDKRDDDEIPHLEEYLLDPLSPKMAQQESDIWQKLWDTAKKIVYLRRPIRAAETQVSAVVLAKGNYASLPDVSATTALDFAKLEQDLKDAEIASQQLEEELNKKIQELLEEIKNLKSNNESILQDEKELVEKASATVEATVEAFEKLNSALGNQSENLKEEILKLTAELNLLKGDELKEVKKKLAEAEAKVKDLEASQAALQNTINQLRVRIKELEASGGDSGDTSQLRDQLKQLQQQLFDLQDFIKELFSRQEIKLEKPGVLMELRKVEDGKSQEAQKVVLEMIEQNSKLQASLIQLLSLMPSAFDDLNWLSLEHFYKEGVQEDALTLLNELRGKPYVESMINIGDKLKFSDDLISLWKKQTENSRIFRFSPIALDQIKPLKINQLLPASLKIADEDRAAIKEAVSADSSLTKPLTQLKTLVAEKYQTVLWATVPVILEAGKLTEFVDYIQQLASKDLPLGLGVAATNSRFKLSASLRNNWAELDLE